MEGSKILVRIGMAVVSSMLQRCLLPRGALFTLQCLKLKEQDGPTLTLLQYMEEFDFTAPSEGEGAWKGYRELTEK